MRIGFGTWEVLNIACLRDRGGWMMELGYHRLDGLGWMDMVMVVIVMQGLRVGCDS